MASPQKLEAEVELKCNAQKYWECAKDFIGFLKGGYREGFESLEILEGDGKSPGSIFQSKNKIGPAYPHEVVKMKIELVDEEKKTVTYCIIDGDVFKNYKSFKFSIVVIPKGEGTLVKWINEFSRATDKFSDDEILYGSARLARCMERFALNA